MKLYSSLSFMALFFVLIHFCSCASFGGYQFHKDGYLVTTEGKKIIGNISISDNYHSETFNGGEVRIKTKEDNKEEVHYFYPTKIKYVIQFRKRNDSIVFKPLKLDIGLYMCRFLKSEGNASIYSRVFDVDGGTNPDGSANTAVIVYYILVSKDSVIQINPPPIKDKPKLITFSEFIEKDEKRNSMKSAKSLDEENGKIFGLKKTTLLFINKRYNRHFSKKDFKNFNGMLDYILDKENELNKNIVEKNH